MPLPADRLPQHVRDVGIAWIVTETVANAGTASLANGGVTPDDFAHRITAYATSWALIRGMPVATDEHVAAAVSDARQYVKDHADDLATFHRMMGRR